MTEALKRSGIEFAKRVWLDRWKTPYVYAGQYDAFNLGVGADCSGSNGIFIGAAINGPDDMSWGRQFSTETFPGPFQGFRQVSQAECVANTSPIKVTIEHGGGGPNSHMACEIDGWHMESNGTYGTCGGPNNADGHGYPLNDPLWNDWWIYDGQIIEDTSWRQPMTYPRGLDYAGGRIPGSALAAAGISFVCRYLTDGGSGLPGKQLQPAEFADLTANGIAVVFNWETTADFMLGGAAQGTSDASTARAYIRSLPGAPQNPVVYFSADFDATPEQQDPINAYLTAAAQVLGGTQYVGIYGGYWPLSRALDAGVCKYGWQSEAWSGGNIDSRINIMQRNSLGYQTVGGVQCDINDAHTDDYGQFPLGATVVTPPDQPAPVSNPPAVAKPTTQKAQLSELWDQELIRWDFLNGNTVAEAIGAIGAALKLPGYSDPTQGAK